MPTVPEKIGDGLILNRNKNYDTPRHLINTKHEEGGLKFVPVSSLEAKNLPWTQYIYIYDQAAMKDLKRTQYQGNACMNFLTLSVYRQGL